MRVSELSVEDMGTVATSFNRSRYTTLPSSTSQPCKTKKAYTLYVYLLLDVCHYLAERRVSTFPLDNLTKVSTDSFSEVYFDFGSLRYISTLGGVGAPERTEISC